MMREDEDDYEDDDDDDDDDAIETSNTKGCGQIQRNFNKRRPGSKPIMSKAP